MPRIRTAVVVASLAALLLMPASAGALDRTVSVKGSATQEVPNDTAGLGFSVVKERKSRVAALRVVSIRMREVLAAVQAVPGVGPGDVTTGAVSIRKVVIGKSERTVFRAAESISVILHQPDRAGEMIGAAVAAGATGTRGPNFFPGDPEAAYNNALVAAFDQAKAKAQALASRAGAVLGPVISIEEGAEVVPAAPTAKGVRKGGEEVAPPVKPGASTVTGEVRVVFSLE